MGSSPRGVLILDIDGSINPFFARSTLKDHPEKLPGFEEHFLRDASYGDARVFLQTAVLRESIRELQELGIELVWGSAWNENSNLILRMLFPEGAEHWPTVVFPEELDFTPPIQSWKLATVREFIEEHYDSSAPLIWVDDEIFGDAEEWFRSRPARSYMLRPERHRGATADDWKSMVSFARSLDGKREGSWHARDSAGSHSFWGE